MLRLSALLLALSLAACAQPPPLPAVTEAPVRVELLGEVHDNAEGHRRRLEMLRDRVAAGDAPVIAMEQFDRERQAALDAAMARCAEPACVIEAAAPDGAGWDWDHYAPVIQLALDHELPLRAANLSRERGREVVERGFAALDPELRATFGLDQPLPEALLAAQVEAVREGHCDMLPEAMLVPMARAQVARDVVMADVVLDALEATGGPVVLLAGNGHVKRGIGVPWWLRGRAGQWVVTGFVEEGSDAEAIRWYDRVETIPSPARRDPCASFSLLPPAGEGARRADEGRS